MEQIITLIQTVGFPIACAVAINQSAKVRHGYRSQ